MDLKGSIESKCLRVYPSEKLIKFLQAVPPEELIVNFHPFIKTSKKLDVENAADDKLRFAASLGIALNPTDHRNYYAIKKVMKVFDDEPQLEKPVVPPKEESSEENKKKSNKDDSNPKDMAESGDQAEPKDEERTKEREGPYLLTADVDWLYGYLQEKRKKDNKIPYLHELIEGADIEVPLNKVIKRNPVLEARCVKLRAQQEAREYRKMTRGVDNVRMRFPDDSIAYQLKQINRQLIAIGQFIISIFAGFLFGFRGVEWMVGNIDFGVRLLLGVMCALIIALAEIYFLAKKLNEELSVPETVQLGGPPKFVDEEKYGFETSARTTNKEHQD